METKNGLEVKIDGNKTTTFCILLIDPSVILLSKKKSNLQSNCSQYFLSLKLRNFICNLEKFRS